MTKHTLKVLRYSHRKIFKVYWSFFNIMLEKVKSLFPAQLSHACRFAVLVRPDQAIFTRNNQPLGRIFNF